MEEKASNDTKASLTEHLLELRSRLIYSFAAVIVLFFISYYFASDIYGFLVRPLADVLSSMGGQRRLIFTALHEAFFTYVRVSLFTAVFLAFPFISVQMWMFIAPGLYDNEKKAVLPFLVATPILFFMGGAMVYYFVFPLAWKFFLSFESGAIAGGLPIQLEAKVDQYLSLVMRLIFAFGLTFELPVLMTFLGRMGIISSKGMREKRKYAVVFSFVAAAILTPPDIVSQIGLALPTLLLYEISILCVAAIERGRNKDQED